MRRIEDEAGARWDVVLGRESWGALYALFVPVGAGEARQALLRSAGYNSAQQELDEMSEERLLELLRNSEPKP